MIAFPSDILIKKNTRHIKISFNKRIPGFSPQCAFFWQFRGP